MLLFNRYEYNPQTDLAGRGEFSRVYKGIDTGNQQPVAIKIYRINELNDHYRHINNIEAIQTLEHPGICPYLNIQEIEKEDSFGEKEKLQVCITAFMNADSLVNYYKKNPDPAVLKKLLFDVLSGLSYLHAKDIIHGYIKPSNILVTETTDGLAAKLTDFAMGPPVSDTNTSNAFRSLIQALPYLSPEQLNPNKYGIDGKVSFNTDIWSLGLVVYESLTGESLFKSTDTDFPETIIANITTLELPEKINRLPEPFKELVACCLVKDANKRAKKIEDILPFLSAVQLAKNILSLEEKPAPPLPEPPLTMPAETREGENADDTRIIVLPKKEPITATAEASAWISSVDDTRVMAKPGTSNPPVNNNNPLEKKEDTNDTPINTSPSPAALPPTDLADDHTQIISKPGVEKQQAGNPVAKERTDNDTKFIANPVNELTDDRTEKKEASTSEKAIDETIIIAKVNKEKNAGVKKNGKNKQAANDNTKLSAGAGDDNYDASAEREKQPDVIIRRREKPVVLFNRYEYLPATDLIGKGGFSRVYKAFDKKLSRWVALKIYKTGEFSDRYSPIAEIKRVVNLDHSNICRYLDIEEIENENPFGENEKIQVCVMELLDSGNFAEYYKTNKNPEVLKKLIQDILNGLSYLHKNGIIHRDIKPGNILIKQTIEGPVAKITDFGISKNSDAINNNSSSALIVSIPYMAPEQLNAKKYGINENISFNLDLWSLGVTIYEVVTGKVLFKNSDQDNSEQIMANIMAPELPEKLNDLPEPFKNIVSHCVIKSARERASRAEELMVLLNTVSEPANTTAMLASQAANTIARMEKTGANITQQAELVSNDLETSDPVTVYTEKTTKPKFSILEPEESPVLTLTKKKIDPLQLTIGTAVVLFILFFIYLKTCNRVPVAVNNNAIRKADSARQTITAPLPVSPPDSTGNTAAMEAEKKDTVVKNTVAVKPTVKNGKKNERAAEDNRKKESVPTDEKSNTAPKYVLILSTTQTCTIKVNSMDYGELESGKPLKVYLITGKYILHFTSSSNSALTYTANIQVKPENLNQVGQFKVPF